MTISRRGDPLEAFSSYSLAIPLLPEGSTNLPAADKPNPAKILLSAVPSYACSCSVTVSPSAKATVFIDNSCGGTSSGDAGGASGPGHLPGDKASGVASG